MRKSAARYASQPTINAGQNNGMMGQGMGMGGVNSFSTMCPFTPGTNLGQAAKNAPPNPAAQIKPPTPALANVQGIQQALNKAGTDSGELDSLLGMLGVAKTIVKRAETQTSV